LQLIKVDFIMIYLLDCNVVNHGMHD